MTKTKERLTTEEKNRVRDLLKEGQGVGDGNADNTLTAFGYHYVRIMDGPKELKEMLGGLSPQSLDKVLTDKTSVGYQGLDSLIYDTDEDRYLLAETIVNLFLAHGDKGEKALKEMIKRLWRKPDDCHVADQFVSLIGMSNTFRRLMVLSPETRTELVISDARMLQLVKGQKLRL